MFQESGEDLFNFLPNNQDKSKKRGYHDKETYTCIKKPSRGTKLIRIELYDVENLPAELINCKCHSELCVQYVVKNMFMDDVYKSYRDIVLLIKDKIND